MKKKIVSLALVIISFTTGASALSALAEWTAPSVPNAGETAPCTPPKCNVAAPVNVGASLQEKLGPLTVNSAIPQSLVGLTVFGGLKIPDGKGVGKVLTSDADGVGRWADSGTCVVNLNGNLPSIIGNSGKDNAAIKTIGVLEPGTYTFVGTGQTTNISGGGIDAVFLSTTQYPNSDSANLAAYPEIQGYYYGATTQGVTAPNVTYNTGPIIYAVKRSGYNDTTWTIPNSVTRTITVRTYVYVVIANAVENGYVSISGSLTGCGGGSPSYPYIRLCATANECRAKNPTGSYNPIAEKYVVGGPSGSNPLPEQNVYDYNNAKLNSTDMCRLAGYTYVGHLHQSIPTSCGYDWNGATLGSGGWGLSGHRCGTNVEVISAVYCQQTPVALPSGLIN